jgi:hypothetical protein
MARETGYSITVKVFVPVNMSNLDEQIDKAQAVRDAVRANDLAGLAAHGKIESVVQKLVNRITGEDAPASTDEPEGEEGTTETGETQADEAPRSRRARGAQAAE